MIKGEIVFVHKSEKKIFFSYIFVIKSWGTLRTQKYENRIKHSKNLEETGRRGKKQVEEDNFLGGVPRVNDAKHRFSFQMKWSGLPHCTMGQSDGKGPKSPKRLHVKLKSVTPVQPGPQWWSSKGVSECEVGKWSAGVSHEVR